MIFRAMGVHIPDRLERRRTEIAQLCERLGVRRLELFGSAGIGANPCDFDFLVDLGELSPRVYANAYFELLESLEAMLGNPVDLVTPANLENPYFRERVEQEKTLLYAA